MLSLIIAILAFGFVIFIHELGHYLVAKAVGVKVYEFAIGMGPKIVSKKIGETIYSLRLFPIGGFNQFEDLSNIDEEASAEKVLTDSALSKEPVWKRALIFIAGSAFNLIFGFILCIFLILKVGSFNTTVIHSFEDNAQSAEFLEVGDKILEINGTKVSSPIDFVYSLMELSDDGVDLVILRAGEKISLENVFFASEMEPELGKEMYITQFYWQGERVNITNIFRGAFDYGAGMVKMGIKSIADVFTAKADIENVSGPVGITSQISTSIKTDMSQFFYIMALVTISLGLGNLLPLPILDGGKLLFLGIEAVIKRPVSQKIQIGLSFVAIIILLALMLVAVFNDISRLIT